MLEAICARLRAALSDLDSPDRVAAVYIHAPDSTYVDHHFVQLAGRRAYRNASWQKNRQDAQYQVRDELLGEQSEWVTRK